MRRAVIAGAVILIVAGTAALVVADTGDGPSATTSAATATAPASTVPSPARRTPATPALCRRLTSKVTGRVRDAGLNELSGLVISRTRPELLYAHEDSGAGPEVWALRSDGAVAGGWTVPGAEAIDWEDIATGPAPGGTGAVLYLGDIGDNRGAREVIDVYRVPEPPLGTTQTAPAERLRLRYPDGPHDAEALLVDPRRGTLVIVTKEISGGRAYSLSAPIPFGGDATLRRGPVVEPGFVTAGDISADGKVIALRGYTSLAVWTRRGREPVTTTLRRSPCLAPTALIEGQGEALALDRTGGTARTVVEDTPAALRRYRPAAAGR